MKIWPGWERKKNDLREELDAHLRIAVEERMAKGEPYEEAHAAATREMGNPPLVADVTRASWGWQWLERAGQDVRYALRQLRKSPGYTATALITLTLAIGANTAVFGLMYALLLKSLPVERPDRMVQFEIQLYVGGNAKDRPSDNVSGKMYDALSAPLPASLNGLCAWDSTSMNLREASGTRPVPSAQVTGGCFRMLGVHAALGRLIGEEDDKPGGGPEGYAMVLGYDYWHSHLGGDPNVVGRVLDVEGKKGVVVGVMEPGFESVSVGDRPWIYMPSEIGDREDRHGFGSWNRVLLGRLKDGATVAQVLAQSDPVYTASLKAEKEFHYYTLDSSGEFVQASGAHLVVMPGRTGISYLRGEYAQPLYLIEGLVGLSLLVACAYLASLAGTRALARRRELAVRVALGASRGRLTAQLCWESLLLAFAGMGLGLLFAWGTSRALVRLIEERGDQPLTMNASPTGYVLLFALGVTGLTVLLAGVVPAWRASRVDPVREIKEGELELTGRRPRRMGSWLAPVQIGLSLVIVVIAALMSTTLVRLLATNPGFSTSGVTFTRADFTARAAQVSKDSNKAPASLYLSLLEKIRHSPGVESVSLSQAHQFGGATYLRPLSVQLPSGEVRQNGHMPNLSVGPDYFRTMGIPLVAGRDFTPNDKEGAPKVCILSRAAAEFFFPGQNAVGQMVSLGHAISKGPDQKVEVIGVVGDTLYNGLREKVQPIFYEPFFGTGGWNPYMEFSVRSRSTAEGETAVKEAFRQIAPDVPLYETVTMSQLMGNAVGRERMVAVLAGFFAVLTLVLSAIGMYGLLNYSVLRRKREIGVRMALGASRTGVVRLVVREALWMVVPGILLGAAGAWVASRFVRSLLFGVKPLDPWVLAASAAVLLGTAVLACLLPARRASTVHPMEALRTE
ncbi:ABC transporter permease [Terracidiphilus gabretensis]|uniref:ABC transporter permease n=1 Tax=Terracidiphilus gabretensis TaxID=1577687 RepID=UPI00071BB2EF|nr:ABC transporter permease [Terracidiphilus gabretensis]